MYTYVYAILMYVFVYICMYIHTYIQDSSGRLRNKPSLRRDY